MAPIIYALNGSCNRGDAGGFLAASDGNHAHWPSCALTGIQVACNLEMANHVVVRIEPVEKDSVIGAQAARCLVGSKDQRRAAIVLHGFQRARSNQVVNLPQVQTDTNAQTVANTDGEERKG